MGIAKELKILMEMVDEQQARSFYVSALDKCIKAASLGRDYTIVPFDHIGYRELEMAMEMLEEDGLNVEERHSVLQIFWDEG